MAVDTDFEAKSKLQAESERDVEQLNVLVGETKTETVTVKDLEGKESTFNVEMFSNYKTAQVLKMLAAVKHKVDIVKLIGEIWKLTQNPTQYVCPHCYADGTITVIDKERDDIFPKTEEGEMRIGCGVCARDYFAKDAVSYTPNEAKADRVNAALEAIPTLMEFAPELLIEYSALALTTNKELEDAYDKAGEITKILKAKEKWIRFKCAADVPLQILTAFVPAMGLNFLVQELGNLDKTATKILKI